MNSLLIFNGTRFDVISYGNGTAYAIFDKTLGEGESAYVQGDDATQFREEWEAYEKHYPDMPIDDILWQITSEFMYEFKK